MTLTGGRIATGSRACGDSRRPGRIACLAAVEFDRHASRATDTRDRLPGRGAGGSDIGHAARHRQRFGEFNSRDVRTEAVVDAATEGEHGGWFETLLVDRRAGDTDIAPAVHARALADKTLLDAWDIMPDRLDQAEQALTIARELGDQWRFCRSWGAVGGQLMTGGDLRTALHLASHGADASDARLHETGHDVAGATRAGGGPPRSGWAVAALGPACAVLQPQ
jgi:hypothetical protein